MAEPLPWYHEDGGRYPAGFRGQADDCVTRAIAIATGRPYREIYDLVNATAATERPRRRARSSARTGVSPATTRKIMASLGWEWHPTMAIGTGCQVHLAQGELPAGRLIARLSRHVTAVINGVVYDTHDPGRDGTRCVYGYYRKPDEDEETPGG